MADVIIIDDDPQFSRMFCEMVGRMGHRVTSAQRLAEGLERVAAGSFDIVFLDVRIPDGDGLLDGLPRIRDSASQPEVVIITGYGDPDGAELAIRSGAWDYVEKPASLESMKLTLMRAVQYREEKKTRKAPIALKRCGIVGSSPKLMACLDLLAQASAVEANVLIKGETGTGKELFAHAIHHNSARSGRHFVVVDCAALPETLVESILFGHQKGAFTGATHDREGLIKQADGGTLLLDEVAELPLTTQKTFLRVIQERRFRPIGGVREFSSDFRLIACSNRDLFQMVREGTFREDLFFRLQTITLVLPPLRERLEDIPELVLHYVNKICTNYRMDTKGISPDFLEALKCYAWPGNVRELINVLERTISLTRDEPTLFAYHLPMYIRIRAARQAVHTSPPPRPAVPTAPQPPEGSGSLPTLQSTREAAERAYLTQLMAEVGRDIQQACERSGLSRARLYQLLKKYEI